MTRLVAVLLLLAPLAAVAQAPRDTPLAPVANEGQTVVFVFVVKPGKTPLRGEPKLDAPSKGLVGYGQKLTVAKKGEGWFQVSVPGETLQGWINAKSVVDKRPGLDSIAVAGSAVKVTASETASTAGAIRGLDGRTAGYATAKQIPPDALVQLGRLETHGERLFRDPHFVDGKGAWRYRDTTASGRWDAAQGFAKEEGLHLSRPRSASPSPPKPAASPTPTPAPQTSGTPAP